MQKFFVGDDSDLNSKEEAQENGPPESLESLKAMVKIMSVSAEVETRGRKVFVRVMDNTGDSMFLGAAAGDYFWLNRHCDRKETRGAATFYYFSFA